jgi:hypothetical protein
VGKRAGYLQRGVFVNSEDNRDVEWTQGFSSRFHLRSIFLVSTAIAALMLLSGYACAQEWPNYGGDLGGARYSALEQITAKNVNGPKVAWT